MNRHYLKFHFLDLDILSILVVKCQKTHTKVKILSKSASHQTNTIKLLFRADVYKTIS